MPNGQDSQKATIAQNFKNARIAFKPKIAKITTNAKFAKNAKNVKENELPTNPELPRKLKLPRKTKYSSMRTMARRQKCQE